MEEMARNEKANSYAGYTFKFLDHAQMAMIDEALHSLGDFGEVRLTVRKGRLRFLVTQRSFDALKWQQGEPKIEIPTFDPSA